MMNITENTRKILKLCRSKNVTSRVFFNLIDLFDSVEESLDKIKFYNSRRKNTIEIASEREIDEELALLDKMNASIITFKDKNYPKLLLQTEDLPPVLTYIGNLDLLLKDTISFVGSRSASVNGMLFTKQVVKYLMDNTDVSIVSGFAKGIDFAAHSMSIPRTVAVLAGGVDHIYPRENQKLYHEVAENGLIISERKIGYQATAKDFPIRNRIIAGISVATVIVEAGQKSGSLITANLALEQGKEIFAVPGSPLDDRSFGTNQLIREGANILSHGQDIVDNLIMINKIKNRMQENSNVGYVRKNMNLKGIEISNDVKDIVLSSLSYSLTRLEDILECTDLPLTVIHKCLLELELCEKVVRASQNRFCLKCNL